MDGVSLVMVFKLGIQSGHIGRQSKRIGSRGFDRQRHVRWFRRMLVRACSSFDSVENAYHH